LEFSPVTRSARRASPPPWESGPKEIAIDAFHHAVYAAFTALAFAALEKGSS